MDQATRYAKRLYVNGDMDDYETHLATESRRRIALGRNDSASLLLETEANRWLETEFDLSVGERGGFVLDGALSVGLVPALVSAELKGAVIVG